MCAKDEIIVPNVTGVIDLLGFSSYLDLSKNDLRTKVGSIAKRRLQILKESISKVEKEKKAHPECYPKNILIKQITDSIIISSDIDSIFLPKEGQKIGAISYENATKKAYDKKKNHSDVSKLMNLCKTAATEIGYVIGIIARLHEQINFFEKEESFPGCRTTIATGLRLKNNNGSDDLLSGNFAFSLAWKLNDMGKNQNIRGNSLYMENHVAYTLRESPISQNILRMSKFEQKYQKFDPYAKIDRRYDVFLMHNKIKENRPFEVELGNTIYRLRKLNPIPLTAMQFIPNIDTKKLDEKEKDFFKDYFEFLEMSDQDILDYCSDSMISQRGYKMRFKDVPFRLRLLFDEGNEDLFSKFKKKNDR